MKKQGFTLIELMVVIVIMGILAAVAVPKLFAQIDKSKASEVGPAAGTYVHDQDAYVVDQNAIGTFAQIGYDAPSSNYFTYTNEGNNSWMAVKGAKGPDCANPWTVTHGTPANNKVTHTATAGCANLTPNFENIGKAGSSS